MGGDPDSIEWPRGGCRDEPSRAGGRTSREKDRVRKEKGLMSSRPRRGACSHPGFQEAPSLSPRGRQEDSLGWALGVAGG